MDGLNDYLHDPLSWAIEVILDDIDDVQRCSETEINDSVDSSYDFIKQSFSDNELAPPSREALTYRVTEQIENQKYIKLVHTSRPN